VIDRDRCDAAAHSLTHFQIKYSCLSLSLSLTQTITHTHLFYALVHTVHSLTRPIALTLTTPIVVEARV